jgi:hypothetical protein
MSEKSRLTATYLMDSFAFFREARAQCNALFQELAERGQRRLVLVGAGDLAEIARLVARDHLVEIIGIVSASADAARLRSSFEELGPLDATVITSFEQSRETFAAAVELLGPERVYAPDLLRVLPPAPDAGKR